MIVKFFKYSAIAFLSAVLLWGAGFFIFTASAMLTKPTAPKNVDAIVVFTGGYHRIDVGLLLFSQEVSRHLFITGINPQVPREDILKRSSRPLPACCISYDLKATNTIENALETRNWASEQFSSIQSLVLVTSDYHMHRAAQEIAFALPDVKIYRYAVPAKEGWTAKGTRQLWFVEYHKFLYRSLLARIY